MNLNIDVHLNMERGMYERLAATLAERIAAAPGMSVRQLAEGAFAPPIEVPRVTDVEARLLGGRV